MKTKFGILIIILFIIPKFCNANDQYEKIYLPLDNENGIPYCDFGYAYAIEGFDIDEKGNFYFIGGEKAVLVCFNNSEIIYRNEYDEFMPNKIYLNNDNLYVFDYKYDKNNLFVLDKTNGIIKESYSNIIKNRVNNYEYIDTNIIMRIFNLQNKIDMTTETGFVMFDLKGNFIKAVNNIYNLQEVLDPKLSGVQYLGIWSENLVFIDVDVDTKEYLFILKNNNGDILCEKRISIDFFGDFYYENPTEYKKLRNGFIYVLGKQGDNAVITKIPLEKLFE